MTILDTTVLSNFAATGQLDLLRSVLGTVTIPSQVEDEVYRGLQEGHSHLDPLVDLFGAAWVEVSGFENPSERQMYRSLLGSLGYGEAAGIAMASNRNALFASVVRCSVKRSHLKAQ